MNAIKYTLFVVVTLAMASCASRQDWPDVTYRELTKTKALAPFDAPSMTMLMTTTLPKEMTAEPKPKAFAHEKLAEVPWKDVTPETISAVRPILANPAVTISPYTSEKVKLFSRCLIRDKHGRIYYTSELGRLPKPELKNKVVSQKLLTFSTASGRLSPTGWYYSRRVDPEVVLNVGFVNRVSIKGTTILHDVAIPPDYSKVGTLSLSAKAGSAGGNGSAGARGRGGLDGSDGQGGTDGVRGRWYGQAGQNGSNGRNASNGRDASPGGIGSAGANGGDGRSPGTLQLVVEPVTSTFYEEALVKVMARRNNSVLWKVISSNENLKFVARGGTGGNGGSGGNGGVGGDGGDGGTGGSGGDGGYGIAGYPGRNGQAGVDATKTQNGTDGQDGGDGSDGGDGGDGGIGGPGGDGGNGGDGGDGGGAGDAGNGGDGATLTVLLVGEKAFADRLEKRMTFDVAGGRPGRPGNVGRGGAPGRGGPGGNGGKGGTGGQAGAGGQAGLGGLGGKPYQWYETVIVTNPDGSTTQKQVLQTRPGGRRGRDGRPGNPGRSGDNGEAGKSAANGGAGKKGNDGPAARPGNAGNDGKVVFRRDTEK